MGIFSRMMRGTRWERLALPPIETPRLRVAPLRDEDAEAVQVLTDDPAVTGAVDFLPERFSLDDAKALIRSARSGRDVFLGIRSRDDGALVGVMGAHLRALQALEIGYWIGGASRGRGYAGEGVGAVVRILAQNHPRRAIVAECRPENDASWNMLLKLGFHPTGDPGHRPGRKVLVWESRPLPKARASEQGPAVAAQAVSGKDPF